MSVEDRASMHEVMEQQTVTIQKAGIHTSLNARCSVFAAANPVYGTYNRDRSVIENICFPDSLLSRFDLLFIVLDSTTDSTDRLIASHVLTMHQHRESAFTEEEDAGAYIDSTGHRLSLGFLRKYVLYARHLVKPKLTEEACRELVEAYTDLRNPGEQGSAISALPITARTLDSLIRLSEAHARCRISKVVESQDARVAIWLLRRALYGEQQQGGPEHHEQQAAQRIQKVTMQLLEQLDQVSAEDILEHSCGTGASSMEISLEKVLSELQRMQEQGKLDYDAGVAYRKM